MSWSLVCTLGMHDVRSLCARHLCAAGLSSASALPHRALACSVRSTASAAGSPRSTDSAAARLDRLFCDRGPLLTLERSRGDQDASLWATGVFRAGVYPDLPVATTWPALLKRLSTWCAAASASCSFVLGPQVVP